MSYSRRKRSIRNFSFPTTDKSVEKREILYFFILQTIFHEEVTEPEKLGIIATLVRWVRDEHPQVFTTQSTQPQYELKANKDLNFIDDTSTYEFLVLPLSEEGKAAINRHESYKDIFMPYHR